MTVDTNKVNYYSGWDIDQLIAQGSVTVGGAGNTTLATITNASLPNIFEVMFQPTGQTSWFQMGTNSTTGALAGLFICYSYMSGTSLIINTSSSGTARYYVWSDKVNY